MTAATPSASLRSQQDDAVGGGGKGGTPSDLVRALNHGIRRSVLRFLLERPAPASSAEIRGGIRAFLGNNLNFQLDTLVATGAVTRKTKISGYRVSFFYAPSQVVRAPWFLTVLNLTAGED